MEQGYRTIIWGLFIATFHINLFEIPIFPAFIGWLIIISGMNKLLTENDSKSFLKARIYALIIFIISLIIQMLPLMRIQNEAAQLLTIIYSIFYLLFVYYLLEGSIKYLRGLGEISYAEHYYAIQRAYIIIYVLDIILACVAFTIADQVLLIFTAVLGIILVISFMVNIKTIKNIEITSTEEPKIT